MPKRKLSSSEKLSLTSETLAREKPRNPAHMVIVMVEDETDNQGEPIVTVVRMKDCGEGGREKSKRTKAK
jgi:hypothetical protein